MCFIFGGHRSTKHTNCIRNEFLPTAERSPSFPGASSDPELIYFTRLEVIQCDVTMWRGNLACLWIQGGVIKSFQLVGVEGDVSTTMSARHFFPWHVEFGRFVWECRWFVERGWGSRCWMRKIKVRLRTCTGEHFSQLLPNALQNTLYVVIIQWFNIFIKHGHSIINEPLCVLKVKYVTSKYGLCVLKYS